MKFKGSIKEALNDQVLLPPTQSTHVHRSLQQLHNFVSKKFIWVCLIIAAISLSALWVYPHILSLYYEEKGGKLLTEALHISGSDPSAIPCSQDPLTDETARAKAEDAVLALNNAVRYNHNLSHAYMLLGRAYCSLGQADQAVEEYRQFINMRPENPLGHLELGFAYERLCYSNNLYNEKGSKQICNNQEIKKNIFNGLSLVAGRSFNDCPQVINSALIEHRFMDIVICNQLYLNDLQKLSDRERYGLTITSIISGEPLPSEVKDSIKYIPVITDTVTLKARNFQWADGTPLSAHPDDRYPEAGVIWWNGCASEVIDVQSEGIYHFILRVQNRPPKPTILELQQNLNTIARFSLSKEDMSWDDLQTTIHLDLGLQMMSVCFLNDGSENGIDRNAFVESISISKK